MSSLAEERQILDFLEKSPKAAFSAAEICRKAGHRRQFEENPRWAIPALLHLRDLGLVEDDGSGHYQVPQDD